MGDNYTYTSRCRGRENFSDHCSHNGPSQAVWMEIILAGWIIFGLFCCYVKWYERRERIEWIEWNSDSSDAESNNQGYVHMHPDLNKRTKSGRRGANSWLSKISSRTLKLELTSLYPGRKDSEVESTSGNKKGIDPEGRRGDEDGESTTQGNVESSGESVSKDCPLIEKKN